VPNQPPRRLDFDRRVDKITLMARELKAQRLLKRSAIALPAPRAASKPVQDKADPEKVRWEPKQIHDAQV
jgi:hypothetical protein